ncbi:SDR family NAD(P)-dependent oxidoreductase [Chloroflexota bacterium]
MRLKDKVVIITGSSRALGKGYALRFAREGAKVAACDILDCAETVEEIKAKGGEALSIKADITSEEDMVNMAKKTVEHFGRIDILVNNAALYADIVRKPFHEISVEEWDKVMAVNLKGMFLCCKAVFPYMKEQENGKIVNISSAVHHAGVPNFMHYVASKSGVIGLTRSMAREVGPFNINVNAIAPGLFLTDYNAPQITQERLDKDMASRSIKRYPKPEDLQGVMVFLSSEDSDFITGQTIVVDGGGSMQ